MKTITIGRGNDNTIVVPKQTVSAHHAEIVVNDDGTMHIKDLNSTNGTFVNGNRLQAQTQCSLSFSDNVKLADQPFDLSQIRQYMPRVTSGSTNSTVKKKRIGMWAAIAAIVIVAGLAATYVYTECWTEGRVYKHYASSVGCVFVTYGYQMYLNDEPVGEETYILAADGTCIEGTHTICGTGFFIAPDGRLATNLHLAKPWLFTSEGNRLALIARSSKFIASAVFSDIEGLANVSQITARGKIISIKVTPNGLPLSNENAVSCEIYRAGEDTNRDVAILQTVTHTLPNGVNPKSLVSVPKSDIDPADGKQGTKIFAIGFPYGKDVALADKVGLQNQIQSGSITQDHGEFEFGHNAASAEGMSGAPIFNKRGHLVGIHHAGMTGVTGAQGFNWAVKAKYLVELNKN